MEDPTPYDESQTGGADFAREGEDAGRAAFGPRGTGRPPMGLGPHGGGTTLPYPAPSHELAAPQEYGPHGPGTAPRAPQIDSSDHPDLCAADGGGFAGVVAEAAVVSGDPEADQGIHDPRDREPTGPRGPGSIP